VAFNVEDKNLTQMANADYQWCRQDLSGGVPWRE